MAAAPPSVSASGLPKVDSRVLRSISGGRTATYWAILRSRADLSGAASIKDWTARGWYVYDRLNSVASSSQRGLQSLLKARRVSARAFWITNAIRITSKADILSAVAARTEVARVVPDWSARIETPVRSARVSAVEWNIQRVNAPQVWSTYNDRGEGIVVANIDTGVQWNHPALVKQYRGLSCPFMCLSANHNYNWFDPSKVCSADGKTPCDNIGHGTHTMGTMVGDDRGSNQIGVAPRAYWMTAKGCETNHCSGSALLASGQWMLAPKDLNGQNPRPDLRPDVVNNSWAIGPGNTFYRATVQAWVASGIFPQFAIGNSGPGCGTSNSPGDYPESYAAGAFNNIGDIALFSSRGPSAFGGIVKPNIAAPGVNVRSSVPPSTYANFTGTSMASPHVAGTVALIWAGAPSFRRDIPATRAVLDQTAVDVSDLTCGGSAGNNNVWGEGRLDAFAAVTKAKGLSG
ncbi:MAG TPA: S8 family serine peptidase [Actinomycetota bacterium]|jgi:subtilisin family serine protease